MAIDTIAPLTSHGISPRLSQLHSLTASMAAALSASATDPGLHAVCRTIGITFDAALVSYRSIQNGCATFVAGWSPFIAELRGEDRRLLDRDALPQTPFCERAPVYLLPEPAEEQCGILDSVASTTWPRLVIPSVVDGSTVGYLHLTLMTEAGVSLEEQGALTIASQLSHQLCVNARREHEREARSALDDLLRRISVSFLSLAPGEEPEAIDAALAQLGGALSASHITNWDVTRGRRSAVRSFRWTAVGSLVPEILSPDPSEPNAAITVFNDLTEPIELANATGSIGDIIIDTGKHEVLSPLVVPSLFGTSLRGAVVVSRPAAQPWLSWEKTAISLFADLIPQIRTRLATEAQVMASFYDAPVGITLRGERGQLLDCNQAFLDFLGVENERDLLGQGGIELLASEELTDEMFDTLLNPSDEGTRGLELPYRHADGSVVWGRISSSPLPGGMGVAWLTHIEDITATRADRERDRERATQDALTGLPNRHQIHDRLEELLGQIHLKPFTVMMLDLNGFKGINDTDGHIVGDELLSALGRRLRNRVRSGDLVGRFGGDEFVAVLNGHHDDEAIAEQMERLRSVICAPIQTSAGIQSVGVSIGAATSQAGDTVESLLARADEVMYHEKASATGRSDRRASV